MSTEENQSGFPNVLPYNFTKYIVSVMVLTPVQDVKYTM